MINWHGTTKKNMTSKHEYQFVNGAPPEDYVCPVCTSVARNPHQVCCCGGVFCMDCLQKLEDSYKKSLSCPLCRKSLVGKKYFKDYRVERYINNLEVYCTNKDKGCTWNGTINKLEKHVESCGYEGVECSDCREELLRKDLNGHLADYCPKRQFPCPNCKLVGAYRFITSGEHINECPDIIVPCPNKDCGKEMYRKLLQPHQKICPKEIISCSYSIAGCCVTTTRETVMEHESQFTQEHLHMALEHIQQQDTKIQEQDTKIQELNTKIQQQDTKIQELNTKIRKQDTQLRPFWGTTSGLQFH